MRLLWRFILIWLIETGLLYALGSYYSNYTLTIPIFTSNVAPCLIVAFLPALLSSTLQLTLILTRLPVNVFTLLCVSFLAHAVILQVGTMWIPGFMLAPFYPNTALTALTVPVINLVVTVLVNLDDEYSFYEYTLHTTIRNWHRKRQASISRKSPGMVVIQIDGLSIACLNAAVKMGLMPAIKELINSNSHTLVHYECGLPSQTSSCQAGIMYGNNSEIPAFRWYDKLRRRVIVSNHLDDANLINNSVCNGNGLLRGGSSINNLLNGDAARSLLTLSTLTGNTCIPTIRAIDDLGSFWFNPYSFTRTICGVIGDLVLEITQSVRQRLRDEKPRIGRILNGQLFMRALTNIFLRDLSTHAVIQEVCRDTPVIYTTFMGYDQVAHHAGPDSNDALKTLSGLDRQVCHIQQAIKHLAISTYELIILSDHGQSFGATFRQRYMLSLQDLIGQLTGEIIRVSQTTNDTEKNTYTSVLIGELEFTQAGLASQPKTVVRRTAMQYVMRQLVRLSSPPVVEPLPVPQIVVCASGNLAHLYITSYCGIVTLDEVERLYPKLISGLLAHEGIGIIAGHTNTGDMIVTSACGSRNITINEVTGKDPLAQYEYPERRAIQLQKLMSFRNSGDLIIVSPVYLNGTVASYEELVGVHGGMGGKQLDAFILAPTQYELKDNAIVDSTQVYEELIKHRASFI